jgi:hypothetical protein
MLTAIFKVDPAGLALRERTTSPAVINAVRVCLALRILSFKDNIAEQKTYASAKPRPLNINQKS